MADPKKSRDVLKKTRENQAIAQQLAERISELAKQAESTEIEITKTLNNVKQILSSSSTAQIELQSIHQDILKSSQEYQEKKTTIDSLLESFNKFNKDHFIPHREDFLDEESGVQAVVSLSRTKKKSLDSLEKGAKEKLQNLEQHVKNFEQKLEEFNRIAEAIVELQTKAQDPEQGLQANLTQVGEIRDQINKVYNETRESNKISNELKNDIEKFRNQSQKDVNSINQFRDESNNLSEKIKELYDISQTNLTGGVIDKTRKQFAKDQNKWLYFLLITVLATGVAGYLLYSTLPETRGSEDFVLNLVLKYSILLPLIFFVVFCGRQYKLTRISAEKYTFKTVLSVSLEGRIYYLLERFRGSEARDRILDFSLRNFEKLYDEPFYDDRMKMKYTLEQDKIRFGGEDEVADGSIMTENLKDTVTREASLKPVDKSAK